MKFEKVTAPADPISIYDTSGVERFRRRCRIDPVVVRAMRNQLLKRFASDEATISQAGVLKELDLHALSPYQRTDSRLDGATKLLFQTRLGNFVETVILRISTGRTALCISSQVGCAAACQFCATGHMGLVQNLSVAEILDQVVRAGQLLAKEQRSPRNIVLMGMGEPFHNEVNVFEALRLLTSPDFFSHPPGRILLSSVGVADALLRCAQRFPDVHLAVSLHSVRQEVRERLIPLARKYPLDELRSCLVALNRLQRGPVMIEYLMLAGLNDGVEDARELTAWLQGLNVHVNLIPYNPVNDAPFLAGSRPDKCRSFAAYLKDNGFKTTIRYSLGKDIAAACGQLARQETGKVGRSRLHSG